MQSNITHDDSVLYHNINMTNGLLDYQICPGLNANEIQIPYDEQHKVSSLVKSHQTHNFAKYEVI